MQSSQIQLKISLSEQLNDLLKGRALLLGVPVTQLVKHILIKEVEKEAFPLMVASNQLERISKKALGELDESQTVEDIDGFFRDL